MKLEDIQDVTRKSLVTLKFAKIGIIKKVLDPINSDWGRKYLVDSLGRMPGLPAKVSQMLYTRFQISTETTQVKAMPIELVKQLIEERSPQLAREIESIDPTPKVASLGQVHQAFLKSGQSVAVKVQFPRIEQALSDQLDLLLNSMERMGSAKALGFNTEGYRSFLEEKINEELNYHLEAKNQQKFYETWKEHPEITIPQVLPELSHRRVLVQTFESSLSLNTAKKLGEQSRKKFSDQFASFFLTSVFGSGLIHTDLHRNNFGFREKEDGETSFVLYDFGSFIHLTSQQIAVLRDLILQPTPTTQAIDRLRFLGFRQEQLEQIHDKIPELLGLLFEPIKQDKPFSAAQWKVAERIDDLLKERKWHFRLAGPPWFFFFMRSVQGGLSVLNELDIPVSLQVLFDTISSIYRLKHPSPSIPSLSRQTLQKKPVKKLSNHLRISIKEDSNEIVSLELPSHSVDNLEELVPPETRERIEKMGYDLVQIKKTAQESSYAPQDLFETQIGRRFYKVWLQ